MTDLWRLLLLDIPFTWVIITGLVVMGLLQINFVKGNINYYFHRLFGYGKCMDCGKKRESMWLLVCNKCYEKKQSEESKKNAQ